MTSKPRFLTFVFTAGAVLAGSQARAGFTVAVNFDGDATGAYSSYYADIRSGLQKAADEWSRYVQTASTTLAIRFEFSSDPSRIPTANAGSLIFDQSVPSVGGVRTYESGTLAKLTRSPGLVGPGGLDAVFNLSDHWLKDLMWFGPVANLPSNKLDSNFVFMHELGHILGFVSYRQADGSLTSVGGSPRQYTFDAETVKIGGGYYFDGTFATIANGGAPVALTGGNYSHVGNSGSDLVNDVMNGVQSKLGKKDYELSGVDVGVLADLGYELTAAGRALVYGQGPAAVPEPASIVALALGLCGVGGWRAAPRRRRAA